MFAVYVDVRYETKGLFTLALLFNSSAYREFVGYVIVAKNSVIVLDINQADRQLIYITVFSNLFLTFYSFGLSNIYNIERILRLSLFKKDVNSTTGRVFAKTL